VIGYIDLPVAKMFYIPGEIQRYIFGITDLTFRMLALRLDFREQSKFQLLYCLIYLNTRGIKNIGGTNKPLTPCQFPVNASIPVEYIFQYIE
jgi:hypothetical protein